MQMFELSPNDAIETPAWEPLLIERLSILNPVSQQHDTGKRESLSISYLCLEKSTWTWCRPSCSSQVGTHFLIALALWRWWLANCSPILHGETSSLNLCSSLHDHEDGKLQAWGLLEMAHLELSIIHPLLRLIHLDATLHTCLDQPSSFFFLHDSTLRPTHGPSDVNGQTYK